MSKDLPSLFAKKDHHEPIVMVTCYNYPTAQIGVTILFGAKYNTKLKRVGMGNHIPLVVLKRNFPS